MHVADSPAEPKSARATLTGGCRCLGFVFGVSFRAGLCQPCSPL